MTTNINIEKGEKNEGCHSETEHPLTQGELLHQHGELNRGYAASPKLTAGLHVCLVQTRPRVPITSCFTANETIT